MSLEPVVEFANFNYWLHCFLFHILWFFTRSYVSIIYSHAAVSKSLRQSLNNVTIKIDFFFLIYNKCFIDEKEQCVYDCNLTALEHRKFTLLPFYVPSLFALLDINQSTAHISKETILSSESIKRLFGNVCTWLRGLLQ